ncbi:MAG: hypothetical protein D6729_02610 [Deltaproteobacteria bacterium]|nr:MAG: hypothetical protein D6729_02610 [Deltaproteobacteria bacterium]
MARDRRQAELNMHFAEAQADAELRLRNLEDAFIAVERTLDALIEQLSLAGWVDEGTEYVQRWRTAIRTLRARGLPQRELAGLERRRRTTCPGCNAVLPIEGRPGERCDWCGHVFTCVCPSCHTDLGVDAGAPGSECPYCRHRF